MGLSHLYPAIALPSVIGVTYSADKIPMRRLASCVPLIILVISKSVHKNKYTVSKTIIWVQSWICIEIHDLDLHTFENISKLHDLDLHSFDHVSKNLDLDLIFFENISKIQNVDVHIFEIISNINNLDVQIYDF